MMGRVGKRRVESVDRWNGVQWCGDDSFLACSTAHLAIESPAAAFDHVFGSSYGLWKDFH